jgi:hypothetical protein
MRFHQKNVNKRKAFDGKWFMDSKCGCAKTEVVNI